eukprot:c53901_g1_i1.p1 GENE.c53901_g1_i1~~c53901_g1_i1.p1  ORF type:complete len:303 (-),score=72.16 c53901_g1_i1:76-855(-)
MIAPDLEDSVPPDEKDDARQTVRDNIPNLSAVHRLILPRLNNPSSGLIEADAKQIVSKHIRAVMVGKVESLEQVKYIAEVLDGATKDAGLEPGSIRIVPSIETALGVQNVRQICLGPRVDGIAFGLDDFTADMGIPRTKTGREADYAKQRLTLAAHASGIACFDSPWTYYLDEEGLVADCDHSRRLGFTGKCAIHPSNLAKLNATFSPSPSEVKQALHIKEAYEEAQAMGRGSTGVDGMMVDAPVYKRACALLERAKAH